MNMIDGNSTTERRHYLLLLRVVQSGVGLSRGRVAQMQDLTVAMHLEGATV